MYPVSLTVFIERFRAAVSVLIGPCCPALLKSYSCKCTYCCIIGQINKWWWNDILTFLPFSAFHLFTSCLIFFASRLSHLVDWYLLHACCFTSHIDTYWHYVLSTVSINVCVRTTFHVVTAFCQLTNKRIGYVMLCYTWSPRTELNCSE